MAVPREASAFVVEEEEGGERGKIMFLGAA